MPIYEYKCSKCGNEFERLVLSSQKIECPKCDSNSVEKKFSVFGMSGVKNPTSSSCTSSCSASSCSPCK